MFRARRPGIGYFTLELARLVGSSGRVLAIDVQPRMLELLRRRVSKAGLLDRTDARLASAESMGIDEFRGSIDFMLAFAVVHELADARLLLADPKGQVKESQFEEPSINGSHAAALNKELCAST